MKLFHLMQQISYNGVVPPFPRRTAPYNPLIPFQHNPPYPTTSPVYTYIYINPYAHHNPYKNTRTAPHQRPHFQRLLILFI